VELRQAWPQILDWVVANEFIFAGIIIKNGKNSPRKIEKTKEPDGLKLDIGLGLGLGLEHETATAPR
jgi:hypothetical protein